MSKPLDLDSLISRGGARTRYTLALAAEILLRATGNADDTASLEWNDAKHHGIHRDQEQFRQYMFWATVGYYLDSLDISKHGEAQLRAYMTKRADPRFGTPETANAPFEKPAPVAAPAPSKRPYRVSTYSACTWTHVSSHATYAAAERKAKQLTASGLIADVSTESLGAWLKNLTTPAAQASLSRAAQSQGLDSLDPGVAVQVIGESLFNRAREHAPSWEAAADMIETDMTDGAGRFVTPAARQYARELFAEGL